MTCLERAPGAAIVSFYMSFLAVSCGRGSIEYYFLG